MSNALSQKNPMLGEEMREPYNQMENFANAYLQVPVQIPAVYC